MATSASTPITPPVPVASNTVVLTPTQQAILDGINAARIDAKLPPLDANDPATLKEIADNQAAPVPTPVIPSDTVATSVATPPVVEPTPVVPSNTVTAPTVTPAVESTVTPVSTDTVVLTPVQQRLFETLNESRVANGLNPLNVNDPATLKEIADITPSITEPIPIVPTDTVLQEVNGIPYAADGTPLVVNISGTNIPPTVLPPLPVNNMNDVTGDSGLGVNTLFSAAASGLFGKTAQKVATSGGVKDWRFRMSLAPSANYMYKAMNPGILTPLKATNGVIFPYSPQISVSYTANYSNYDLTHSNFKIHTYKNSSVENVTITGDFTAQDTTEANYLLAVMHFFKSVTKMFYGQDQNPQRGIPPPLLYLSGFGQYQFDMHPVVVTSYTHTFPTDVDYINAYPTNPTIAIGGLNLVPFLLPGAGLDSAGRLRQLASTILPGGMVPPPAFNMTQNINQSTRVPTKVQIQLQCLPVVTRNLISNKFSLREYSNGSLMKGSTNGTGGGIW